jgi:hypothetical protein
VVLYVPGIKPKPGTGIRKKIRFSFFLDGSCVVRVVEAGTDGVAQVEFVLTRRNILQSVVEDVIRGTLEAGFVLRDLPWRIYVEMLLMRKRYHTHVLLCRFASLRVPVSARGPTKNGGGQKEQK